MVEQVSILNVKLIFRLLPFSGWNILAQEREAAT